MKIYKTYGLEKKLFEAFKKKADKNCQTMSAIIRMLIEEWLKK